MSWDRCKCGNWIDDNTGNVKNTLCQDCRNKAFMEAYRTENDGKIRKINDAIRILTELKEELGG